MFKASCLVVKVSGLIWNTGISQESRRNFTGISSIYRNFIGNRNFSSILKGPLGPLCNKGMVKEFQIKDLNPIGKIPMEPFETKDWTLNSYKIPIEWLVP